jgi:hypothetical protein
MRPASHLSLSLRKRAPVLLLSAAALFLGACEDRPRSTGGGYVGSTGERSSTSIKQPEPKPAVPQPSGELPPGNSAAGSPTPAPSEPEPAKEYSELTTAWLLGSLHDLGPAGPATATESGVFFVTRDDQLLLAARKGAHEFVPLPEALDPKTFAKYGRGPAMSKTHAYWVSESRRLVRRARKGGPLEVLAENARLGTRTSVLTAAGRDVVAYIAEVDQKPLAHVWSQKGSSRSEIVQITPEGASASSVALVEGAPHPRAVVLAGRYGMSPVHVRRIRTTARQLTLEPDEVIWVGPGSHVLTEIHAQGLPNDHAVAFLPTARNFNDFGLAQLSILPEGGELKDVGWYIYPNGLDPAPVATAKICGKHYVLYARPTEARPRSPQELHLAEISGNAPKDGEIIARSRAFNDLSLSPTSGGAVAAWTADKRTWGITLTCPSK